MSPNRKIHHLLTMTFLVFLASPSLQASCLEAYKEQVANKRFFNSKQSYQLILNSLEEASGHRPMKSLLTLQKKVAHSNQYMTNSRFAHSLLQLDQYNLLCQNQRPLKVSELLENYQQLKNRADRETENEIAVKHKTIKTPKDFIEVYSNFPHYEIPKNTLENFLKLQPKPSTEQILQVSKMNFSYQLTPQAFKISALALKSYATPDDFFKMVSGMRKPQFSQSILADFFALTPAPSAGQIIDLFKMQQKHLSALNFGYQALNIANFTSPAEMINVVKALNLNIYFQGDISRINKFFDLDPTPNIEEIIKLADTQVQKGVIRSKALDRGLVKTPAEFILLYKDKTVVNFEEKELKYFFKLIPKATFEQVITLRGMVKDKEKFSDLADENDYVNTPQEYIEMFAGLYPFKFRKSAIADFFGQNPSYSQIQELTNIADPTNKIDIQNSIDLHIQKMQNAIARKIKKEVKRKLIKEFATQNCDSSQPSPHVQLWTHINPVLDQAYQAINVFDEKAVPTYCATCMEDKSGTFYTCPWKDQCQYSQCADCVGDSIKLQLKEKQFPFECDSCNCQIPLKRKDFSLLKISDKRKEYLEGTYMAEHIQLFPQARECPTPDCANRITRFKTDQNQHYACEFCQEKFCIKCHESHPHTSCENHAIAQKEVFALKELAKNLDANIRPCPYCYRHYSKDEKCTTITCRHKGCGQVYDWVEGQVLKPTHNFGKDKTPRNYLVPGEIHPVTGQVCTKYTYIGKLKSNQRE